MTYKTSLDKTAKVITIGITILFAVIIAAQLSIIKTTGFVIPVATAIGLVLAYLIAFAFRPINYQLTTDKLIIHRPFADVKINKDQIKSVLLLDKEKMSGAIRTFGVGGMFGYYGKFYNSKMGSMTLYATRKSNTVLVETTDNRKIILTPDDPQQFVVSFNSLTFDNN